MEALLTRNIAVTSGQFHHKNGRSPASSQLFFGQCEADVYASSQQINNEAQQDHNVMRVNV